MESLKITNSFYDALESNNLKRMQLVAKSDLHNHSIFGGDYKHFESLTKRKLKFPRKFYNYKHFDKWINKNIFPEIKTREIFESLLQASFLQAKKDNIIKLEMSISIYSKYFYNSIEKLIKRIKKVH